MKMSLNHQTRNGRRFEYDASILIDNYPHGAHYIARMVNFSQSGACLHVDKAFTPGKNLILAIENSPYPDCPGVYVAVVKWCRAIAEADPPFSHEIGIRYLSTRPADLNQYRMDASLATPIDAAGGPTILPPRTDKGETLQTGGPKKRLPFDISPPAKKPSGIRRYHRRPCVIPTHYTTQEGICWGIIKNINRRGIYIEKYLKNHDSLHRGEAVTVMMPSKNTNRTVKIIGEIVWMDAHGYGVKFKSRANANHNKQHRR